MNEIKIFQNEQFGEVRVAGTSEEPLFCAKDIAAALGYSDTNDAVSRHCKSGVKVFYPHTNGVGGVNLVYIPEKDVYRLIMRSKLPDAEKFQDWICDEILPSIRKTGGYLITKEEDTPETIMARALLIAKDALDRKQTMIDQMHERNQLQAKELKQAAPKVEYYDTALNGQGTYSATDIAKDLGMAAVTLNKKLHALDIQYKQHDTWYLYADYQGKGYTRIIPNYITDKNGVTTNHPSMRWTELGRGFIIELQKAGKI